jgi:cell wall-associated NlpC family hydrolase
MATATCKAPGFSAQVVDLIGLPFVLGARGPAAFDCYGLVAEVERRNGRQVPDYRSPETLRQVQRAIVSSIPFWTPCEVGPGAVLVLRTGSVAHVAVTMPFGKFIHSWEKSGGVCIERLTDWTDRIVGAYTYKNEP